MLTAEITHIHMQTTSCNLDLYVADPVKFFRRYVTMDETCSHHFDPEMKRKTIQPHFQWSSFKRPRWTQG